MAGKILRLSLAALALAPLVAAAGGAQGALESRVKELGPLTVVTEEWPPYNYLEGGRLAGFSADVARALMERLGTALPIEVLPGVRAKDLLDKGPRVMFFTMFRTPERESSYKWVGPIDTASFHFYKRKGDPLVVRTLEDARRAPSVACRSVGLVYDYLRKAGFSNLDASANPAGIYRKVLDGRCSLAISETPLGVHHVLKSIGAPADALEETPLHILEATLYFALSADVPDAEIARWQAALDGMKSSGEFQRLYQLYLR